MKSARSVVYYLTIFILSAFFVSGCGSTAGITTDDGTVTPDDSTGIVVADIALTASEYSINFQQIITITATVYSASGSTIPGATVTFSLDKPTLASITNSAVTATDGTASVTLEARELSGEVNVYATVGSVTSSSPAQISILDQVSPAAMTLEANPTSILVEGTATITAKVFADTKMEFPVENGTSVLFSMENEFYGTVTSLSATNNGKATATFEASKYAGFASIKATSGSITESISVKILPASAVAISFLSAAPDVIALRGSGGNEVSTIQFIVKDSNDQPVTDVNVSFAMKGPNGGEYIDDTDTTPNEIDVSTGLDGIASVRLYSGSVAGPVTISGTIETGGSTITSTSSIISIGGGVPSWKRFSMASELINLPGLWKQNKTTEVSTFLADRFGNYNMLNGTSVSFVCESGLAIDTSTVTANDYGIATVTVRTQGVPETVVPLQSEIADRTAVLNTYYGASSHAWGFPRLGHCSVMAYTRGEEHFDDTNANGVYDDAEPFTDTNGNKVKNNGEPFTDINSNGVWDSAFIDTPADPFIDYNDDGVYTGVNSDDPQEIFIQSGDTSYNGKWDGDKYLFGNILIYITGEPIILFDIPDNFKIYNGGVIVVKVLVCDINLNPLTEGTTLSASVTGGKLVGAASQTLTGKGNIEFYYTISDDDPDTNKAKACELKVSVEWEDGWSYFNSVYGTVDAVP